VIAMALKRLLFRLLRKSTTSATIGDLKGEEISTVAFVRDYVEFRFDGPILHCFADPKIKIRETVFQFPETGSRDALCSVIGSTIGKISLQAGLSCDLEVSDGSRITIPLDSEHQKSGESMMFCIPGTTSMAFW
jgi:hypothetical protein